MDYKIAFGVCALLVVFGVAGCAEPRPSHSVGYGGGPIEIRDGTFVMNGTIHVGRGGAPDQNFSDVTVVLYDNRKQVIKRVPVGTLSTHPDYYPPSRRVTITSKEIPMYVVIESPDFRTSETPLEIEGYVRTDGQYNRYPASPDDKFPDK